MLVYAAPAAGDARRHHSVRGPRDGACGRDARHVPRREWPARLVCQRRCRRARRRRPRRAAHARGRASRARPLAVGGLVRAGDRACRERLRGLAAPLRLAERFQAFRARRRFPQLLLRCQRRAASGWASVEESGVRDRAQDTRRSRQRGAAAHGRARGRDRGRGARQQRPSRPNDAAGSSRLPSQRVRAAMHTVSGLARLRPAASLIGRRDDAAGARCARALRAARHSR